MERDEFVDHQQRFAIDIAGELTRILRVDADIDTASVTYRYLQAEPLTGRLGSPPLTEQRVSAL